MEEIHSMTKNLLALFQRKSSVEIGDWTQPQRRIGTGNKYFNTLTTLHTHLNVAEQENLNGLQSQFSKLTHYDQYSVLAKVCTHLIDIYKTLDTKSYLPRLQYLQFVFDLMESSANVFNLLLFCIRLLHVAVGLEQFLRKKFQNQLANTRIVYFEYVSLFYLNIIGIFRFHLLSLALWKDLSVEVFKW